MQHPILISVDVALPLPPGVGLGEGERLAVAGRSLQSKSCLRVKVVYNSRFLNLFGNSHPRAKETAVKLVKDVNTRFQYTGLDTSLTVDVLKGDFL